MQWIVITTALIFGRLYGNPVCRDTNGSLITNLCQPMSVNMQTSKNEQGSSCQPCPTDKNYEYNPSSPIPCFCAVPLGVGLRLKSPGITDFRPYEDAFEINLTSLLQLFLYQLNIESYIWEVGPRLNMHMKLFPSNSSLFNISEIVRLRHILAGWEITLSDVFGPYELLNFTLGSYADGMCSLFTLKILILLFKTMCLAAYFLVSLRGKGTVAGLQGSFCVLFREIIWIIMIAFVLHFC